MSKEEIEELRKLRNQVKHDAVSKIEEEIEYEQAAKNFEDEVDRLAAREK